MKVGAIPPLTQAQIEQAALVTKDFDGIRVVGATGTGDETGRLRVVNVAALDQSNPVACQPLFAMTSFDGRQQYTAGVEKQVRATGAKDIRGILFTLKAYQGQDAAQLMADLRTALRTCGSFTVEDLGKYSEPTRHADPKLGDEALHYSLTLEVPSIDAHGDEDGGAPARVHSEYLVVRSGSTVAAYFDQGDVKTEPRIPMEVVTAQTDKLARLAS